MGNFVMIGKVVAPISVNLLLSAFLICPLMAETGIRDSAVLEISRAIWENRLPEATLLAERLVDNEPDNPAAYFLLGAVYQTISEDYRNDSLVEEIYKYLNQAINLSNKRKDKDSHNANWYFIAGASYGYRGIHKAFHGSWWQAFKDGFRCQSNLKKAVDLDSTYYDAYWGLGSYYYYRTVKSKVFLWLPFVSDMREEGIALVRMAIARGFLAKDMARASLLKIYLTEERYQDLVSLADSLDRIIPQSPYMLWHYARGLLALGRTDEADEKTSRLKSVWENSPYGNPAASFEAELLSARVAILKGDRKSAREILERIISRKELKKTNAYFAETYDEAKELLKKIR